MRPDQTSGPGSLAAQGLRCTDAARERGDAPAGTAPRTDRWLLIEHPGPWQRDAVAGSGIAPHILDLLTRAARDHRGRILLIRRPGRQPREHRRPRAWAVVIGGQGSVWGTWRYDRHLEVAAEALRMPWPAGEHRPDPVLLVCAHGIHDTCCAIRGRPVAAALAGRWPEETWECSHVGGDRFAANVVVLPDGYYYGNLDGDTGVQAIEAHLSGQVPVQHLRGVAGYPPPVQAALAEAHADFGPLGPLEVGVRAVQTLSDGQWSVELDLPGRRILAEVRAGHSAPTRLTCHAAQDSAARTYQVMLPG